MAEGKFQDIDFAALKKGDYLNPEDCERLFGIPKTDAAYNGKLQTLIRHAMTVRTDLRCKQDDYGFRVLTDAEALAEGMRKTRTAFETIQKEHKLLDRVNPSNLKDHEVRVHASMQSLLTVQRLEAGKSRQAVRYLEREIKPSTLKKK